MVLKARSIICVFYNAERGRCTCPSHTRTGDLAKTFGRFPACILIGAAETTDCPDRKEPDPQASVSHTIWDRMGDDAVNIDNVIDEIDTLNKES